MKDVTKHVRQCGRLQMKAAEDSRTPRRWRAITHATQSARFWSAAALCRFLYVM